MSHSNPISPSPSFPAPLPTNLRSAPGEGSISSHRAVIGGAIVAAIGGLLFGFDTAVISGTTDALQKVFGLDSFWLGFTVAIALIGTIFGSVAVGKPVDVFGRKKALFALAVCYFVSAIGCGLAQQWWEFLVARFIGGLAIGGTSVVTPMYIAEISPPHLRGRLVMVNQLNVVIGILLSFVSNYFIGSHYEFDIAWRWMLGLLAFPSAVFFLLIFCIPESPRSLVKMGRSAEAKKVLQQLGEMDVENELAAIQTSLADRPDHARERLFGHPYWRPVLLTCAMAVFNQLTGINAMLYYAPKIFGLAGAARDSSLLQSVTIGGTLLVFTVVAMFVIDRFGRRILLLIGSVGMALCLTVVAGSFSNGSNCNGGLVLAALVGYVAFFALSQGAIIWVFISEVFPNSVRAKGLSFGSFTMWFMAATVSWTFPVVAELSVAGAFAFFAAMMVLQFFFAWKIMPETKGIALEDMEERLANGGRK